MSKLPKYKTIPIVNIPKDAKRYRREWLRGVGLVVFCDTPRGVAVYLTRPVGGKRPAKKMELSHFIAYDTRVWKEQESINGSTGEAPSQDVMIKCEACEGNGRKFIGTIGYGWKTYEWCSVCHGWGDIRMSKKPESTS